MAKKHRHGKTRCQKLVSNKIRLIKREGKGQKQAIAISINIAKRKGCKIIRR